MENGQNLDYQIFRVNQNFDSIVTPLLRTEKIAKKSNQRLQIIKKFKVFFKCNEFYKYQVPPICCNDSLLVKFTIKQTNFIKMCLVIFWLLLL